MTISLSKGLSIFNPMNFIRKVRRDAQQNPIITAIAFVVAGVLGFLLFNTFLKNTVGCLGNWDWSAVFPTLDGIDFMSIFDLNYDASATIPTAGAGGTGTNAHWGYANALMEACKPIAEGIVIAYTVAGVIQMSFQQGANISFEQWFFELAKGVILFALIDSTGEICEGLLAIGDELASTVSGGAVMDVPALALVDIHHVSLGDLVPAIVSIILNFVAIILLACVSCYIAIIRAFKIALALAFAPLSLMDIGKLGFHSQGYNFAKKLVALSLQGVMVAAIVIIGSTGEAILNNVFPADDVASIVTCLLPMLHLVPIVVYANLLLQSESLAFGVLGVH